MRGFRPIDTLVQDLRYGVRMLRRNLGVVGDTRHRGLDKEIQPEVYLPYMQHPDFEPSSNLAARVATNQNNPTGLSSWATAIRNQAQAVELNEPVDQVITMDERLSNSIAGRRYVMILLSIFAAVAFVIATVGIYGVISYVNARTRSASGWPWARRRAMCCEW
jgi:putative ABC transport system permease protein